MLWKWVDHKNKPMLAFMVTSVWVLVYFSSKFLFLLFYNCRKKVLDPNGPYISTSQIEIRNVCLSVILEFCLSSSSSSVVCTLNPAYPSLCRGLKYTKSRVYYSWLSKFARIFSFQYCSFAAGWKRCPMPENNVTKMNGICVW